MKAAVFHVCGASGSGKSTVTPALAQRLPEYHVVDCDALMGSLGRLTDCDLFAEKEAWPALINVWLAIAATNAAAGRSTVLLSPSEPRQLEEVALDDRPRHYLLLDCSDAELTRRLMGRGWDEARITASLTDAKYLRTLGLDRIDSTGLTHDQAAAAIEALIRRPRA